jgi:hypothetical protein
LPFSKQVFNRAGILPPFADQSLEAARGSRASRQRFDYLACHFVENRHLATLGNKTAPGSLRFGNAVEPYRLALSVNLNPKDCIGRFRRQFIH